MKNLIPALVAIVITTAAFFNTKAQNAQNSIAKLDLKVNTMQFGVPDEPTNYITTTFKNSSTLNKASSRALKDFAKSFSCF